MDELERFDGVGVANTRVRATPFSVLWAAIKYYPIDDRESSFKFSDRLARENRWTKEYTMRVIEEYKKFMFLAVVSEHPVTPSIDVDECWHLHMLYTRDYWINFKYVLRGEVHHGPTKGGKQENEKFTNWYEKTKDLYSRFFGSPPEDIWPPSHIRFRPINLVKVDSMTNWIVEKGDWRTLVKYLWDYFIHKIKSPW